LAGNPQQRGFDPVGQTPADKMHFSRTGQMKVNLKSTPHNEEVTENR